MNEIEGSMNGAVAAALRDRFESDALLGSRYLPIRLAKIKKPRTAGSPASPAPGSGSRSSVPAQARPSNREYGLQPEATQEQGAERLVQLDVLNRSEVENCVRCGLHTGRTRTVFGVGSALARIMFVGEGPGADEDASGIPFVGRAGELLTRMIESGMGLRREEVYICNVVKCRPPGNRTPAPDEILMCKDFLLRQIDIVRPEVIIALGAPASQTLLNTREPISRIRGRWHEFYPSGTPTIGTAIPLMPTFHPAYLLRTPADKVKSWADLKMVMARLGIPLPARG